MTRIKEKAFWIAFGDFGGRGLAFLTSIYLARVLGAEYYGMITVAVAILGYATWLADLGLVNIGVRETAKEPENREFRAKEIFNLKIGLSTIVLIISTVVIYLIPMGPIQQQVTLAYLYSLVPYSLILEWYYNGRQEFGKVALSRIINNGMYLALVFWLVTSFDQVTMVPILYTIGVTSAVVVLATFAIIDKPFSLPTRSFNVYKKLFKKSALVGVGGFFSMIVQLLPPIIIGAMLTLKDAGIYGAAFRIIVIAMMLDRIFVNLLLPNLASLWQSNKENAAIRVNMVFRLILVAGTLVTLLTAINSEQIIWLLFGDQYYESAFILKILSLFIFFTFLNSLFAFGLLATGNDHHYFLATSTGGILCAVIITVFSVFGTSEWVAIAVVSGEFVLTIFSFIWFKKHIQLNILKPVLVITLTGSLIFYISELFSLHFVISSTLSVILLVMISWYARVIKIGDLNWAKDKLLP